MCGKNCWPELMSFRSCTITSRSGSAFWIMSANTSSLSSLLCIRGEEYFAHAFISRSFQIAIGIHVKCIDWLIDWFHQLHFIWLIDWLISLIDFISFIRLIDWLIVLIPLIKPFVRLIVWFIYLSLKNLFIWLFDWSFDRLIDWLIVW